MDREAGTKERLDRRAGAPGYDTARVHVGGIFIFFVGFGVAVAGVLFAMWRYQGRLQGVVTAQDRGYVTEVEGLQQPLQPSPGHAALPWEDMAALREKQERWLHSAGAMPGDGGRRHIPIEQAIDRLMESGVLKQAWENPATMPYVRPAEEKPRIPSVENRT